MAVEAESLYKYRNILEDAHKGFAYELLSLEIEIENTREERRADMIAKLSKLIQLYMLGVEALESHWDDRYRYFNDKIQSLMKKKHVVEELHMASTGNHNTPDQVLREADKQLRDIIKSEFQISVFLNSEQCNVKKVKQIVQRQEIKFTTYQNKIKTALESQNDKIAQRIQRRKMKSECYSARNFDLGSNPSKQKQKQKVAHLKNHDNDDIFQQIHCRGRNSLSNKRRGSIDKKKPTIKI